MTRKDVLEELRRIRKVGLGEPVNGVYAVPGYDHDGKPVSFIDDEEVIEPNDEIDDAADI